MKNYKNKVVGLGGSDIAMLVINSLDGLKELKMGGDGSYSAYVVNNYTPEEIPSHYTLKVATTGWAKVYDDDTKVAEFQADKIEFYRAGEHGIIVNLINERR